MASSAVDICNSALVKVGADRIISLTEDNQRARLCNDQYSKLRDDLLRAHPWNFAIKRVELAASSTDPEYDYTTAYELPSDCLRVLGTDLSDDDDFKIEASRRVLCNSSSLKIKYIAQITDVGYFDSVFSECLALKIAADIAYSLSGSAALSELLYKQYKDKLSEARSFDAQEGSADRIISDEWLNSRL